MVTSTSYPNNCHKQIAPAVVWKKVRKGKFTIHKTNTIFSRTALDQNHEQLNSGIKGVGGAIALTENNDALITGPKAEKLLKEFKIFHRVDKEGALKTMIWGNSFWGTLIYC